MSTHGENDPETLFYDSVEARIGAPTQHDRAAHAFFASDRLNEQSKDWLLLAQDFENALTHNQLELWFQPQFSLLHRQISGMEGLLRWNHPKRGMVSPSVFIDIAESIGVMPLVNRFVLAQIVEQIQQWDNVGYSGLRVAINLSLSQILDSQFIEDLLDSVTTTSINGNQLEIEFIEDPSLDRNHDVKQCLQKLRNNGISMSLASFGVGQASLTLLSRLPLDRVKIDRSIVANMNDRASDYALVQSIINLSRSLGISVVAEGIETNDALEQLARLGCDDVQGYLVSQPLSPKRVTDFLRQQRRQQASNG